MFLKINYFLTIPWKSYFIFLMSYIPLSSLHVLSTWIYEEGHKKVELSSGRWAPGNTGFPYRVRVVGAHLYQWTSWCCCESLLLTSVNFSEDSQCICLFYDGWFTSAFSHNCAEGSAVFDQKWHVPHSPLHLFTQSCPPKWLFFNLPDEKSPQREMFCWCRGGETKNDRSANRHQNQQVQTLFWAVEKMSRQVYCIKRRVLWRWPKLKHVRINT